MQSYWEKLLDVIDATREKVFFFNANRAYVIMSIEQYEVLAKKRTASEHLSDSLLLERINQDIALWKANMTSKDEDERAVQFLEDVSASTSEHKIGDVEMDENVDDEFKIEPITMD